ncbi:hypothetical protein [Bradyrhizobium sp. SZCCHNR2035]|uniref:hypothetical protein n=1 Tax=Bradyrhizobium sp. SZCCHNR2035 TaxID=3057386 RepID=UPI002915CBF6|nr:hypothetical protein [Bradyrhizobium sp. SZCCHNR2035]
MDVIQYFTEFLASAKSALDLYKGVKDQLPKGMAEKAEAEIEKAEAALKNGKAELAKKLGYRLCRCEFPPHVMLWKADIRKNVCPKCGDKYPPDPKPVGQLRMPPGLGRR